MGWPSGPFTVPVMVAASADEIANSNPSTPRGAFDRIWRFLRLSVPPGTAFPFVVGSAGEDSRGADEAISSMLSAPPPCGPIAYTGMPDMLRCVVPAKAGTHNPRAIIMNTALSTDQGV